MNEYINPFHELYLTEAYLDGGADKFVTGFSPILVKHALGLFQPGNIVLKGLPGSGKSMILNLLRPDTRIAYHKRDIPFPVPDAYSKFVGAGINLNRSLADTFGQRPFDKDPSINSELTAFYFSDFINCLIVHDIFLSVISFQEKGDDELCNKIGLSRDINLLNSAAISLANDDCWFGYFANPINSVEEFLSHLSKRITTYRSFMKRNIESIPDSIRETKTDTAIPITKSVFHLRNNKVLSPQVNVFIRIDQYEELAWLDEIHSFGKIFQQVIHKFLGLRDTRVSYRIGTRKFAWATDPRMYGTTACVENERTHKEIDIEEVLLRHENRKTWFFPAFAEDIFARRLKNANYKCPDKNEFLLSHVFGNSLTPNDKAGIYVKSKTSLEKIIKPEKDWPELWTNYLLEIASKDVLLAVLGSAWARQKGKGKIIYEEIFPPTPPWEEKIWWKKERYPQLLMQIASRNQQQLQWSGKDEIIALSGGNILAFLSLCQHIWDVWLRFMHDEQIKQQDLPEIEKTVQSIGIQEASQEWLEKIAKAEHGDYKRKKFIRLLGELFYKKLIDDVAMSNPGHNGFSVRISELDNDPEIKKFLNTLEDFGDLIGKKHTSKTKGEKRRKWYLNPILSPYFNIFQVHTKEPWYVSIETVRAWKSKIVPNSKV